MRGDGIETTVSRDSKHFISLRLSKGSLWQALSATRKEIADAVHAALGHKLPNMSADACWLKYTMTKIRVINVRTLAVAARGVVNLDTQMSTTNLGISGARRIRPIFGRRCCYTKEKKTIISPAA